MSTSFVNRTLYRYKHVYETVLIILRLRLIFVTGDDVIRFTCASKKS